MEPVVSRNLTVLILFIENVVFSFVVNVGPPFELSIVVNEVGGFPRAVACHGENAWTGAGLVKVAHNFGRLPNLQWRVVHWSVLEF